MNENHGLLGTYNLWQFWNRLPNNIKVEILKHYEESPLMWDYKTLFAGQYECNDEKGAISILNLLLLFNDLELCDLLFLKFLEYDIVNYGKEIYWIDAHFFISNYCKRVYSLFINGHCDSKRFERVFYFEFENAELIINALESIKLFPVRNIVFDQYLIYLEKQKQFDECIKVISVLKKQGWNNDFEKREMRCKKKIKDNGNKS